MDVALSPLTAGSLLTGWSLDVPVLITVLVVAGVYLWGVRSLRLRGEDWPANWTAWFLVGGLGTLVVVTMSLLGSYDRVLFWPLAAQDVLLLTLVPVGFTLGRPVSLWQACRPRTSRTRGPLWQTAGRVLRFPLVGSVVSVTLLLAVYTTGWDRARLDHPTFLELTRLLIVAAGCGFLWPLLGIDAGSGQTSYPMRALIGFVDGVLDAVPGLAVLGAGGVIAHQHYARVGRGWGPSLAGDQRLGGAAMVFLGELVGLPALILLLVAWVRDDDRQAHAVDDELDATDRLAVAGAPADLAGMLQRPWWETDAGPLADRAVRYGWVAAPTSDGPDLPAPKR